MNYFRKKFRQRLYFNLTFILIQDIEICLSVLVRLGGKQADSVFKFVNVSNMQYIINKYDLQFPTFFSTDFFILNIVP